MFFYVSWCDVQLFCMLSQYCLALDRISILFLTGGGEFYSNSTVYLRKKLHVFNSIAYYYDGDVHTKSWS